MTTEIDQPTKSRKWYEIWRDVWSHHLDSYFSWDIPLDCGSLRWEWEME
jgi:hypothetical protein